MPRWVVRFSSPVIYRPQHPRQYRRVALTEMRVNAPTAEGAKIHAIRSTAGDGGEITVEREK